MLAEPHPEQELRLAAIRHYGLETRVHEGAFDGLVELAAQTCGCPISMVSIVHADEQRFEASCGLDVTRTALDASICSHAILQQEVFEIPDTRLDLRTLDNPLVTNRETPVLFYAGAPIVTKLGVPLGTICVLDHRPRSLSEAQRRGLSILASQVMQVLELHVALGQQDAMRREVDHRVKNSLANVAAMTRMAARRAEPAVREALSAVERRINVMVELHGDLYRADDPDAPIDMTGYLTRIANHLQGITPPGVEIEARLAPLALVNRRASALGVLVNEMISNACKHGFPDGRAGRIVLRGEAVTDGRYALSCEDDGVGTNGAATGSGLGQRIMEASAAQLDGLLRVVPAAVGYRAELEFPLPLYP